MSRLLPGAIALALTATLVGGGVAAADLRADERRAEAERQRAEAERQRVAAEQAAARALADYRSAVTGFADETYSWAQPLQRAMQDTTDVQRFSVRVLDDVSELLVAQKPFDKIRERLTAITPPEPVKTQHLQLAGALRTFADAADLAAGVADQGSADDIIPALVTSERALDDATREWRTPIDRLFADLPAPVTPAAGADPVPRPLNQVSYLYDVGSLCAGALARYIDAIEGVEDAEARPELVAQAGLDQLTADLPRLLAVTAPQADSGSVRDTINTPLEDVRVASERAAPLLRALIEGRGNRSSLREVDQLLTRTEVAAERAADGYRTYGSATCSAYLVGGEEEGDPPAPDEEAERPA